MEVGFKVFETIVEELKLGQQDQEGLRRILAASEMRVFHSPDEVKDAIEATFMVRTLLAQAQARLAMRN